MNDANMGFWDQAHILFGNARNNTVRMLQRRYKIRARISKAKFHTT